MSITLLIIIITIAISMYAWNNPVMLDKMVLNPSRVTKHGEYYRFVTSGFIHADWGHLLFNMLSLWFMGEGIEQIFTMIFGSNGTFYFLFLYIAGIIVSDIPTFLKHRNNSNYNSLGASGGVSAVIFALILCSPLLRVCLYFAICMPGFIFGLLFLGYSFYEAKKGRGYVNHDAHLYGAIFGFIFMAIVYPAAVPSFFQQIATWRLF